MPVPAAGLENPWDVRKIVTNLQHDVAEVQPLLAQIQPQRWYEEKGAPTTYTVQWQAAQQQLKDVITVTKLLAQRTESLPTALDVYFRLEALELTERALLEGVQKYDTRATADKLSQLIARNFDSRQRLREYIRNLATSTEETFKIADQEAQRCRGMISRESLPTNSGKKARRD
jgi:hypothetical protein